jgi:hypothetical protein
MDFKQNQKIKQVTEKTLVIGIEIAKPTHYTCFVDDHLGVYFKNHFPSNNGSCILSTYFESDERLGQNSSVSRD